MAKKINAKLKRAYYYFGANAVVPLNEIEGNIIKLKEIAKDNDELITKVHSYATEIKEFCASFGEEEDIYEQFRKDEPKSSWEYYTDDFPNVILDKLVETGLEPVKDEIDTESDDVDDGTGIAPAKGNISITVKDNRGNLVSKANIVLSSDEEINVKTDVKGLAIIKDVYYEDYSYDVSAHGCKSKSGKITVDKDDVK